MVFLLVLFMLGTWFSSAGSKKKQWSFWDQKWKQWCFCWCRQWGEANQKQSTS